MKHAQAIGSLNAVFSRHRLIYAVVGARFFYISV